MKIVGTILLIIAMFLLATSNVLWYLCFITGGSLLFGSINKTKSFIFNGKNENFSSFLIYFLYAFAGFVIESIRIYLQLWDYTGIYSKSYSLLFFVLVIYPIFFTFILETSLFIKKYIKHTLGSILLSIALLVLWNEVPNIFVNVWIINPNINILFVYTLSFLGYIGEFVVAICVYNLISSLSLNKT